MNETEIPTPRTDAFLVEHQGWGPTDWNWRCFARQLERENIALQSHLDDLTARSIHTCGDHCQRPNCVRRREMQAMREAIKAAYDALEEAAAKLAGWHGLYESQIGSDDYATVLNIESAITKLKPHLP